MTNPYISPAKAPSAKGPQSAGTVRCLKLIVVSIVLAVAGGVLGLVAGHFVGVLAYDGFPSYYSDDVYRGDYGTGYSTNVRRIVALNMALGGGGIGFWLGLSLPWLRLAWLHFRKRNQAV